MCAVELRGPVRVTIPRSFDKAADRQGDGLREAAITHEVLMGAQDDLTNVLAVMLGVAIGAGRAELVALACASAAVAEAVSMGGVLYSATRARELSDGQRSIAIDDGRRGLHPVASGIVTFAAALLAGLLPLLPFAFLELHFAVAGSVVISLAALFALGSWTGRIGGAVWWRDGVRLLAIGSMAAIASAAVGAVMRVG